MILNCTRCNEPFEAKRKDTKYCTTCKKQVRSQDVMRSRVKYNPNTEVGVGSGKHSKNLPGPTNKAWKTGIQGYRKIVTKTECAYCKSTRNLLVHHIDEDRTNNTPENLRVLCKSCHQRYHVKRCNSTGRFLAK